MSAPIVKNTGLVLNGFKLRTATVTLTNAQIKDLPSTPFPLVAAPGASKMLVPIQATARCASTAGGYTGLDPVYSALSVEYTDLSGPWAVLLAVNSNTGTPTLTRLIDLMGTSDNTVFAGPYATVASDEGYVLPALIGEGFIVNEPLVLALDNNGSMTDLGGGNVANFMVVTLLYAEIG